MFQKKQFIFNENLGVCVVHDITKLSPDNADPILYYVLKKASNKEKVAYIPVSEHQVLLRELISTEEAENILQEKEKHTPPEIEEAEFVLKNQKK